MAAADYIIYQEPPRRALTARNLGDFALCPQKFLLSFFVSRQAGERFLGGAAALHAGVRAALIEGYREGGPGPVGAERLEELFEQHWEGRLCADSLEEEQLHRQGREMLAKFWAAPAGATGRTVGLDLRMEAGLGAHRFVAVADRVVEEEGAPLTLLRYKTARQTPGPGPLGRDLSLAVLLLVGEAHWEREARVGICAVRAGRLVLAEIGATQREAWREQLATQATAIRRAREYPTVVGRHCSVCRCRGICPAWHPAPAREEEAQ
jgi:hypothetical protein